MTELKHVIVGLASAVLPLGYVTGIWKSRKWKWNGNWRRKMEMEIGNGNGNAPIAGVR